MGSARSPGSSYRRSVLVPALGLCASLCVSCAGKLDKPERFLGVINSLAGSGGGGAKDGGTSGSGGSAGTASRSDSGALPGCVSTLFANTCGMTGCHAKGAPQIDLVSPGVEQRLLDKRSSSALCSGRVYIDSNGGDSLLSDKLSASPPCGVRMPLTGSVSDAERTCVNDWVASLGGAP